MMCMPIDRDSVSPYKNFPDKNFPDKSCPDQSESPHV